MKKLNFEKEKAVEMSLFVISKIQSCNISVLMAVCYLADIDHLKNYGRPITGNTYVKKEQGVLALEINELIQSSLEDRNKGFVSYCDGFLKESRKPDLLELSKSDVACLESVIESLSSMENEEWMVACHGIAWNATKENGEITLLSILDEIGDNSLNEFILNPS